MTYGIKTVRSVIDAEKKRGFFGTREPLFGGAWAKRQLVGRYRNTQLAGSVQGDGKWTLEDLWTYTIGCHSGHALEFLVAMVCWFVFFADGAWLTECSEWRAGWVGRVLAFNFGCELVFFGGWHSFTYVSSYAAGLARAGAKFNPLNQYEKDGKRVGFVSSSSGHLQREVTFTTLGWLQSGLWQALCMWLWASGRRPVYNDAWQHPLFTAGCLCFVTYWREVHFYWCHRGMHPWFDRRYGLAQGDVGAFLYRHVHSLHHKSYNPGPWSGLSMHPVEHFLYYSCAWLLPLVPPRPARHCAHARCSQLFGARAAQMATIHPIVFLYAKFHADIAPIGGHDGHDNGGGDFHYLHHAKFEVRPHVRHASPLICHDAIPPIASQCNYGVPFPIDFDKLFGTWVDYQEYKVRGARHTRVRLAQRPGTECTPPLRSTHLPPAARAESGRQAARCARAADHADVRRREGRIGAKLGTCPCASIHVPQTTA